MKKNNLLGLTTLIILSAIFIFMLWLVIQQGNCQMKAKQEGSYHYYTPLECLKGKK